LVISDGLTHEKIKPREMVISWLPGFLKGYDFSLEQGVVSNAQNFRSIPSRTVPLLHSAWISGRLLSKHLRRIFKLSPAEIKLETFML
jgi:hypothetical protein